MDKKCLKCPVRKFSLKAVNLFRQFYDVNEQLLDILDDFDTGLSQCMEIKKKGYELINEYSRCSHSD